MTARQILSALKKGGKVGSQEEIRLLVEEASRLNLPLEARMETRQERFTGRFLQEETADVARDGVLTTPLEPPLGNILVRGAARVELQFTLGTSTLVGITRFRELAPRHRQNALRLELPGTLNVHPLRHQVRYRVPAGMITRALFNHLDAPCVTGEVEDIHLEGISFLCCMHHAACGRDDLVHFTLEPSLPNMERIKLTGKVCYHVRERQKEDLYAAWDRYGVRILNSSNFFALKRLVEVVKECAPVV